MPDIPVSTPAVVVPPAPPAVPTTSTTKTPWVILGVVVVAICLLLMWLAPAYKSVQRENLTLKTENQTLKTQLTENKSVVTYYPNGHVKSKTILAINKKTFKTDNAVTKTDSKYSEVTKRSLVTMSVLFGDSFVPKAGSFNTTLIGPIGAEGFVSWGNGFGVMVGPTLSF